MFVDVSPEIRRLSFFTLEDFGHEVMDAANGKIGLSLQSQGHTEIIITDLFMPEKEGTEFIMDMNKEFPGNYVIATSGGGSIEGVDFLKLAENLFVIKTFKKSFL